ncbi:indolepyruvate oxidoreductase subunit beta [Candidatus Bathyarchaeota archaeon]|nr:indolepyruvate oxidoreductase subunit beta [Candidatus Bathyarchaeota archaeon]
MMQPFKLVVAGVGGQGTLLASRLLAEAAIKSGMHVKIGETYGMAQRGGPVMGHIQIGGETNNPQIRKGEADVLIGFEPAEAVRRGVTYLKKDGLALINTRVTDPVEVVSGMMPYPDMKKLMGVLGKVTQNIHLFDATGIAEEAGDPITTNIVMLGAIVESGLLPYSEETVVETLKESLKPQFIELNMKAFELGKKAYRNLA